MNDGSPSTKHTSIDLSVFILKVLKYVCINHGDQRSFFDLKSSQMSWIVFSASFDCLCYGSTATINTRGGALG